MDSENIDVTMSVTLSAMIVVYVVATFGGAGGSR